MSKIATTCLMMTALLVWAACDLNWKATMQVVPTAQCSGGDIYVANIKSDHTPVPAGAFADSTVTQYQLQYGCGQVVCAVSLSVARQSFADAIGLDPSDARLFVADLGSTGTQAKQNEPSVVVQWFAAGMHCLPEATTDGGADAGCSSAGEPCGGAQNVECCDLGTMVCDLGPGGPPMPGAAGVCCIESGYGNACQFDWQCCPVGSGLCVDDAIGPGKVCL